MSREKKVSKGIRNDGERKIAVLNTPELYRRYVASDQSTVRAYVREHRGEIDAFLDNIESQHPNM